MKTSTATMLDAGSLGPGLDFTPLNDCVGAWNWHEHTPPEQVGERIAGARIAVTNKAVIDAHALAACPGLELICVAATGTNNVDLEAAAAHGVTVCNARGYATPAVAQHVLALTLALATRLEDYSDAVRRGEWQRSRHFCLLDYPVVELAGRTMGIVGLGELGGAVATLARALGMEVLVSARPRQREVPAGRLPFDEVVADADVLSLHCPLTETTQDLIDRSVLERMKSTAFLINTARGALVDEAALADALRAGSIAGAGIDVLSREPPVDGNPLLAGDIPNLIVTPHTAWASHAARQRLVDQVAGNIRAYAEGSPDNVVASPADQ